MSQAPDVVLVRQPGNRTYDTPAPVASMATSEWEYAVLSGNVYVDDWKKRGVPQPDAGDAPAATGAHPSNGGGSSGTVMTQLLFFAATFVVASAPGAASVRVWQITSRTIPTGGRGAPASSPPRSLCRRACISGRPKA